MSPFVQKGYRRYVFTILIHLVTLAQALTLPVNNCGNSQVTRNTTSDPKSATICAPSISIINLPKTTKSLTKPSSLSFPPSPFLYRIPSTPYIIKYTNYGAPIPEDDAIELLSTAQEEIMYEMSRLPDYVDVVISRTHIWAEESARLTVKPVPPMRMRHAMCGLILAGMMECGDEYGFVEADVTFLDLEDLDRPFGNGSLMLDMYR